MATIVYSKLDDEAAKMAIRNAIRFAAMQPGATLETIKAHLKLEVGIEGVAMTFDPKPDPDGSFQTYQRQGMRQFMFRAHAPSGKTIRG